jgi:hypothetical protein
MEEENYEVPICRCARCTEARQKEYYEIKKDIEAHVLRMDKEKKEKNKAREDVLKMIADLNAKADRGEIDGLVLAYSSKEEGTSVKIVPGLFDAREIVGMTAMLHQWTINGSEIKKVGMTDMLHRWAINGSEITKDD